MSDPKAISHAFVSCYDSDCEVCDSEVCDCKVCHMSKDGVHCYQPRSAHAEAQEEPKRTFRQSVDRICDELDKLAHAEAKNEPPLFESEPPRLFQNAPKPDPGEP